LAAAAAAAAANNSSNATAALTQLIAHMLSETRNESANITGWHKDLGKGLAVTHNVDTVGGQTNATETYATTHTRTEQDVSYEAHLKAEAEKAAAAAAAAAANNSSNSTAALFLLRVHMRNETGNKTITGWHKDLGKGLAVTHNVDTVGGQTNATETYATTHTRTEEDVSYVAHLKAEAAAVAAAAAAAAANNSSNATAALIQLRALVRNETGNKTITGWHKDLGKGLAVTHNVDTVGGQTNATETYAATHTRTAEDVSYEAHLKAEAAKAAAAAAAAKANNSSNATL
jgi:aminoglycoside phosphotransferase (APT) family kinase protein